MHLFTSLLRSRDKPQNRTAGSVYSFYLGSTPSGKMVTERGAIGTTIAGMLTCGVALVAVSLATFKKHPSTIAEP